MLPLPRPLRILREWMRDPKNPAKRLEALLKFGDMLVPGYRFSWPNTRWWNSSKFNEYLAKYSELNGFNSHRRWMMTQLLRLVEHLPGDTAECGVYLGAGSQLILEANRHRRQTRMHYMFDSFEGISSPSSDDGNYWKTGDLAAGQEAAESNLASFSEKKFLRGWIPTRFGEIADSKFCFVHVDVDLYQPTKDCIEFFYDRLVPGGVFLCDDYGMEFCPGATRACDEFLATRQEKMLSLPEGGGFFLRSIPVGEDLFDPSSQV